MWLERAVTEGRRESWGCGRRGPSGTTLEDASRMRQHLGAATSGLGPQRQESVEGRPGGRDGSGRGVEVGRSRVRLREDTGPQAS